MTRSALSQQETRLMISQIGCRAPYTRRSVCGIRPISGLCKTGEEGSSIVEFGMVAIILFTVVFGVIAIGFALYSYNVVSEAAREGTRYAIVRGSSCIDFPSACPALASDIQNYVTSLPFPGINSSNMTAVATFSPTTAGAACSPSVIVCNNPGNQVQVTVTYHFPLVIPFVPKRILSMTNSAEMVISQ